jgi:hypothetical protein
MFLKVRESGMEELQVLEIPLAPHADNKVQLYPEPGPNWKGTV